MVNCLRKSERRNALKEKGYRVYLVGTKGTVEGGNDIGEYIMSDAICFGEIEDGVLK